MVEIRIDTKRDSDEEIRKTIRFLQQLIGETPAQPAASAPAPSTGAFNMFGSDDEAPSDYKPEESQESTEDSFIEIVEY